MLTVLFAIPALLHISTRRRAESCTGTSLFLASCPVFKRLHFFIRYTRRKTGLKRSVCHKPLRTVFLCVCACVCPLSRIFCSATRKFRAQFETRKLSVLFTSTRLNIRRGKMARNYASYSGSSTIESHPGDVSLVRGFLSPFR